MNRNFIKNKNSGFIALISVVIISFVLLLVATTLSLRGFQSRFNILDSEYKTKSDELADACVEQARLELAIDNNYSGDDVKISLGNNMKCEYDANIGGSKEIIAHACVNNSHTYYKVIVKTDEPNIPIDTFTELPNSNAFVFSCIM